MESQFGSRSKVVAKGKANVETAAAPQVTPQAAPQVAPTNDTGGIEGMLRSLLSEFLGDRGNPTLSAAPSVTTTELGPTIDTLAVQDAQEQAAIRSASGITESLGRPTGTDTAMTEVNGFTTTPEGDSGAGVTVGVGDAMIVRNPTQGLTSAPVQDTVSEVDTVTAAPAAAEAVAATLFTGTGNSTKPVMTKIKDFATDTYTNPITAAAFSAIVEAESGTALIEGGYKKKRAIEVFVDRNKRKDGTLGPKMSARKAAIEALPEGYSGDDIFDIVYGGRMDNTEPGDGSKYKGRGLIMITGKDRYKALGDTIGVDLVKNPELLETDKDVMLRATLAYLEAKSFSTSSLSQSKLASIIGHSDDSKGTEAKKRWKRTKEIYKEMTGNDMPSRPSEIRKFTEDQSLMESIRPELRPEIGS